MCRLMKWYEDILKDRYSVLLPVLTKIFAVLTDTNEVLSKGILEIQKFKNVPAGEMQLYFRLAYLKLKNSKMCRLVKWSADILKDCYAVLVPVLTKIFAVLTGTNEVLSNDIFET